MQGQLRLARVLPGHSLESLGRKFSSLVAICVAAGCGGGAVEAGGIPIDADGDGVVDGFDTNSDGVIDSSTADGSVPATVGPDGVPVAPGTLPPDGAAPGAGPLAPAAAVCVPDAPLNLGVTRLRRLTRDQLDNTLRDLLGVEGAPATGLAPDERIGPFSSNAIAPITELVVEQHQELAEAVTAQVLPRMNEIVPCDLAADTGTTCATQFVTEFGLRAYRRPLQPAEVSAYVSLYDLGRQGGGASNGFRLILEGMLQAPSFIYHADVGSLGTPQGTPVPLTPYELASRLSYFLWNSMPDAQLFARAGDGSLTQDAMINAEVERMIADTKAGATIGLFHQQWLGVVELADADKNLEVFPQFTPELAEAMVAETGLFADYVVRQGDGLLSTLLTSNLAFPQGELFDVYGINEPQGYTFGTPVPLDSSQRAGILTQAAFLTENARPDQSSPVHRGLTVRENLLCQPIPPPPPGVTTTPPPPSVATSTRERFAQHSSDPSCAVCHSLMDPIGLGFENYDALGQYRTEDGLGAVDATGRIDGVQADLVGPFVGALELSSKLAASQDLRSCVATQWFRFSLGRVESVDDGCSITAIREGFSASGGNIRTLLTEVALSDAFRHVRLIGQ